MSTRPESSDTARTLDDGATEDSVAPSARSSASRVLVAIVSTYLVVVMALGAIPGPTHRLLGPVLRWVGLDQSWEMFTYPPHNDAAMIATATLASTGGSDKVAEVQLPFDQQPEFRWRRYRAWFAPGRQR